LSPGSSRLASVTLDVPALPRALCRDSDPDLWFASGHALAVAKRICRACPERAPCLAFAVEHGERFGVWGGLDVSPPGRRARPRGPGRAGAAWDA
jgi:WhiB family redox-sensing transcriptional regulator